MQDRQSIHGSWASRWTFILAATGSSVGLGNIWKFPYIAGENGGGAFVLMYLVCIALVGIPIMMAEVLLGRRGRQSPVNTLKDMAIEIGTTKRWAWIGLCGVAAGIMILSFYSVVSGWVIAYVVYAAEGTFTGAGVEQIGKVFNDLLADPQELVLWHTLFMIVVAGTVARGVNKGLEAGIRLLMPMLFALLLLLLVYAITAGDFAAGWDFMFHVDFSALSWNAVLIAMGHAFFTLSLGMGSIMVYGSYMPKKASIGGTVLTVAGLDTLVALIAGLAIFPLVFGNQLDPGAGPGLMLVTLPVAFGNMAGGQIFGFLFFAMVAIAAWSSAISLLEPVVAYVVERFKIGRTSACVILSGFVWVLGVGALGSFNFGSDWSFFGFNFFDLLDFMTANIMLPLGGLLVCVFTGWWVGKKITADELNMKSELVFNSWFFVVRFIAPVAVAIVFIANLWQKFAG
ncbi:sodium-dependent transporter [Motiliproteus sp.]|uniref:sodium-dependent transporter n=1 Tax=Motiliproteus sp. TaxID=1898955 RepID=UPI003BAA991E